MCIFMNSDIISIILKFLEDKELFDSRNLNKIWNNAVIKELVRRAKILLPINKKNDRIHVQNNEHSSLCIKLENKKFLPPDRMQCLENNSDRIQNSNFYNEKFNKLNGEINKSENDSFGNNTKCISSLYSDSYFEIKYEFNNSYINMSYMVNSYIEYEFDQTRSDFITKDIIKNNYSIMWSNQAKSMFKESKLLQLIEFIYKCENTNGIYSKINKTEWTDMDDTSGGGNFHQFWFKTHIINNWWSIGIYDLIGEY
jgi:hypothetical protein